MNVAAEGGDDLDAFALYVSTVGNRVRSRVRYAGLLFVLGFLLPVDRQGSHPVFLWSIAGELPPMSLIGFLACSLVGVILVFASFAVRDATRLVAIALATLALGAIARFLGTDRGAWEPFALPANVAGRPTWPIVALSLTAAGASLAYFVSTRRLGKSSLALASAIALASAAWPARGGSTFATLWAFGKGFLFADNPLVRLGFMNLGLVVSFPLVITCVGLFHVRHAPRRFEPPVVFLSLFGGPALLLFFLYRTIFFGLGSGRALLDVLSVLMVIAHTLVLADSFLWIGMLAGSTTRAGYKDLARPFAVAAVITAAFGGVMWFVARPPEKGTHWTVGPKTAEADAFFGTLLPDWDRRRRQWAEVTARASNATGRAEVEEAAHEVIAAARRIDPDLGQAVSELARESDDLDVTGRKWFRLLGAVNSVCQEKHMPYFADPSFDWYEDRESHELRRVVRENSYAVERVTPYVALGKSFATLHVRQLGHRVDTHGGRLGFSSDAQPFALVVLDEVDDYARSFDARGHGCWAAGVFSGPPVPKCDAVVARLVEEKSVRELVLAGTERHELQHQIDGPHLVLSPLVEERLRRYTDEVQDRVNRELSAYLAQLTAEGEAPRIGFVHLAQFALSSGGGTYPTTSRLALCALEDEWCDEVESEPEITARVERLADASSESIRERSRRAYKKVFGVPLASPQAQR
jgi:hypothetical protein